MANWGVITPILVPVIGILAAISPFLVTNFYNQFYGTPNVNLEIIPNVENNSSRTRFHISNLGAVPATNLSFLLYSPNKIIDLSNVFYTTDLILTSPNVAKVDNQTSLNGTRVDTYQQIRGQVINNTDKVKIDDEYLELEAGKLVHGDGSQIIIETTLDQNLSKYYNASVVYTEGSTGGEERVQIPSSASTQDKLLFWWQTNPILAPLYVGSIITAVIVYYLFFARKRLRVRFVSNVTREMIDVRCNLKNSPRSRDPYPIKWWWRTRSVSGGKWNWFLRRRKRFIEHINDYVKVDDFYNKLNERNSKFEKEKDMSDQNVEKLNIECLELLEMALLMIDWKKYL